MMFGISKVFENETNVRTGTVMVNGKVDEFLFVFEQDFASQS